MLKFSWEYKLILGLISGFSFGIFFILLEGDYSQVGLLKAALRALFFGLFFGLTYLPFLSWYTNKKLAKMQDPELSPSDKVLMTDAASVYKKSWFAIGGKLFITKERLIFTSHKGNLNKLSLDIKLNDIVSISKRKSGGILDNGILLKTKSGEEYKLIVNQRSAILELLNS